MKKSALMGTLQKTGLELRRVIIKEVRGHFVKCRFYSTQERLSIGDYGWEWRLEQKGRAFARSEPVGRPVPCGCGEISNRIRNFYVVGKHSLRRQDAAHIAQRQYTILRRGRCCA